MLFFHIYVRNIAVILLLRQETSDDKIACVRLIQVFIYIFSVR